MGTAWLLLLVAATWGSSCPVSPPVVSHLCDIVCFLPNATFVLPPLSVGPLSFSGGQCSHVSLASLSSSVGPGARLTLEATGFGLLCTAHLKAAGVSLGHVEVEMASSSLSGTVLLSGSPLPTSASLDSVQADLVIARMEAGSVSVAPWILHSTKQLADDFAVSLLRRLVATNGSLWAARLAAASSQPLPPFEPLPSAAPLGSLNMSGSVVAGLGAVLGKLGEVVARAGALVQGMAVEQLGVVLPLPLPAGGACAWLNVTRVQVSSFDDLRLAMWTEGELGVAGNASLRRFNASVDATLVLTSSAGQDIAFALRASVFATRPAMEARGWAAVSEAALRETLFLAQVSGSCLVRNATVRGVHLSFEEGLVEVSLDGGSSTLQSQVLELLDNVNLFFVQSYGPSVPLLVAQLVASLSDGLSFAPNSTCVAELVQDPYSYLALFPVDAMGLGVALGVALVCWLVFAAFILWKRKRDVALPVAAVFFLLGSIATYAVGAASIQAWVWLSLRSGDSTFVSTPTLAVLSFASLVSDSWNAGAYVNAIGLALLGLAVPVLRAVATLVLLLMSLYGRRHHRAAMALEALAKLGGFVSTDGAVAKVAFSIVVALPLLEVHVYLYPAAGFYMFLAANVSGFIGAELALWSLRRRMTWDETTSRGSSMPSALGWSRGLLAAVVVAVVVGCALTVAGLALPSIRFVMGGAVAEVVALADPGSASLVREYSVFGLAASLPRDVLDNWGSVGIYTGTFFLCLLGIAMPLAAPVALLVALFARVRSKAVLGAVEVTRAFNGTENWLLVLVASFLSIELLGTFIVGPSCAPIDALLQRYPSVLPDAAGKCLTMTAAPAAGLYVLLAGALLITAATVVVASSTVHLAYGEHTVIVALLQKRGWMQQPRSYELLSE